MSAVAVREAGLDDWPMLEVFFRNNYREGHPLRKREYFAWLVERKDYGHSFIAVVEDRVVAHRASPGVKIRVIIAGSSGGILPAKVRL